MAPPLKLPANFRVKYFGSSRNSNGIGKYLMPNPRFGIAAIGGAPVGDVNGGAAVCESGSLESIDPSPCNCLCSDNSTVQEGAGLSAPAPFQRTAPRTSTGLTKKRGGAAIAKPRAKSGPAKKRRKFGSTVSSVTRRWQEVWAAKYTWAEGVFDGKGELTGVLCTICSTVDGHRKVMVPKNDNLEKHEGKRSCIEEGVPLPDLKVGDTFTKLDCKHLKNVKLWAGRKHAGTVADLIVGGLGAENKRKGVQFSTLFQVLSHGRPMVDYEQSQHLLKHLKVKNVPSKHWSETSGWEMSEHLHDCVLKRLRSTVQAAKIISISADEVTAVDNTCWIGVHVYTMENWERVPHLLHLSHVIEPGKADNLTEIIMTALMTEGGLTREELAGKLVCFGADGVSTFQGCKSGVGVQIRNKWAPFVVVVHCSSHKTNLAVQTLSNYPMVSRLEAMLQALYGYFCRSNKRHAELQKLANLMETKGNKMLKNVATRWISMKSPAQRVLAEYRTLIVKMGLDMTSLPGEKVQAGAGENFDLLTDIEVLLSLSCIQPLLNVVHCLIKFSQARDVFICDMMQAVKECQNELAHKYIDPITSFGRNDFAVYYELLECKHAPLPMKWQDLPGDSGIAHLVFDLSPTSAFARCHDKVTGEQLFVTQEELNRCQDNVERQLSEIAESLSTELERRFPQQELLDAFGIIYPQYWLQEGADSSFQQHLSVLKQHFCCSRVLNDGKPTVEGGKASTAPAMVSALVLDNQQALFKITMKANAEAACAPPLHVNPLIKLWRTLSSSRHLTKLISEYLRLAEIGGVLVLGSVEDERCFSSLQFLKSCQRNRLEKHLPLVVRMFGQSYFTLGNFPYQDAIESWKGAVKTARQGDA